MATRVRSRARGRRRLPTEWVLDAPQTGGRHRLREAFGTADLVVLGLGVTIGGGIYSLAAEQAAGTAGPAVIVSFLVAAVVCLLTALSYAELASTLPAAGSAYTFTYVAFGEARAWLVGWAFLCEMLLATAVIARLWADHALETVADLGVAVPEMVATYSGTAATYDLLAVAVLVLFAGTVILGGRMTARFVWVAVVAKVAILLTIIVVGAQFVDTGNYTPFVPEAKPVPDGGGGGTVLQKLLGGAPEVFGVSGILLAAPVIAFSFFGFDIMSTATEETRNPRRSAPRGILYTLLAATVLYLGVAVVMVGMRPYSDLGGQAPLASAFNAVGADNVGSVVGPGALLAFTTVLLVLFIGLTRLVMSMGRDGLLPESLSRLSRRLRSPARAAALVALASVALCLFVPIFDLVDMVVAGTTFCFVFVSAAVISLRRRRPDLPRGFRVPLVPWVPLLAIASVVYLMLNLQVRIWAYFGVWLLAGLLLYLAYGRRRSRVARLLTPRKGAYAGSHRSRVSAGTGSVGPWGSAG